MRGLARFAVFTVRKVLYLAISGLVGAAVVGIAVYIYLLEGRPDLQLWHLAELDSEYSARRDEDMKGLDAYRRLEDRLYEELVGRSVRSPVVSSRTASAYARSASRWARIPGSNCFGSRSASCQFGSFIH